MSGGSDLRACLPVCCGTSIREGVPQNLSVIYCLPHFVNVVNIGTPCTMGGNLNGRLLQRNNKLLIRVTDQT